MKTVMRSIPLLVLLFVSLAPLTVEARSVSGCRYLPLTDSCWCGTWIDFPFIPSPIDPPVPSSGLACVAGTFVNIINDVLVPLLFAVAFIVFLYGVAKAYIFSGGDEEARSNGHKYILWALIGFAVMVSVWGLVNIVTGTFGLDGGFAPEPPRSDDY